jgi:hypothetical protein
MRKLLPVLVFVGLAGFAAAADAHGYGYGYAPPPAYGWGRPAYA